MSTSSVTSKTIECFAVRQPKGTLESFSYQPSSLGPFDILIEISHCGICHSDLHLINNDWGIASYPLVAGHEIVGTIRQKGDQVVDFDVGERVGVGWQRSSCGHCEWCHQGRRKSLP